MPGRSRGRSDEAAASSQPKLRRQALAASSRAAPLAPPRLPRASRAPLSSSIFSCAASTSSSCQGERWVSGRAGEAQPGLAKLGRGPLRALTAMVLCWKRFRAIGCRH